jgi:hypothetical protein
LHYLQQQTQNRYMQQQFAPPIEQSSGMQQTVKSNLKSRLQTALQNMNSSNAQLNSRLAGMPQDSGFPARAAPGVGGLGATQSQFEPHGYNNIDDGASDRSNVLNERVQRLQGKITGIEANIEMTKNQQIEEYERKVTTLEDKFDDIIDQTEKQFDVMLNDQLQQIDDYLNRDRLEK